MYWCSSSHKIKNQNTSNDKKKKRVHHRKSAKTKQLILVGSKQREHLFPNFIVNLQLCPLTTLQSHLQLKPRTHGSMNTTLAARRFTSEVFCFLQELFVPHVDDPKIREHIGLVQAVHISLF